MEKKLSGKRTRVFGERGRLTDARRLIARALVILDRAPPLIATATLDLALHQLDRVIDAPERLQAGAPRAPHPSSK